MQRKTLAGLVFALTITSTFAHAQGGTKVRLGYNYSLWGAPVVIALETGLFAKHGVEVEGKRFAAGKDARDALIAGGVDMATIGGTPFVVGVAVGEMNAVAAVAYTGKSGCIMVKRGAGIASLDDLKGKKFASRPGSTIDSILRSKILPAHNLKPADFEFVNVDFRDQVASLAAGSVVAFAGVEPFCAIAETEKFATKLLDYGKYDILPNMLASTDKFVQANPQATRAVIRAIADAGEVFRKQPDKAIDILYKLYNEKISRDTLKLLLATIDVDVKYADGLEKYFQGEANALAAEGRLKNTNVNWGGVLKRDFNGS
jgi:ABC-type nitrate/sulfonate/bicarbonate transport system substrate-binding protein